jgi:hypothetical protein
VIHTDVTVRKVEGRYVIDWVQGKPMTGDQVLMSAELFEKSIAALNGSGPWPSTREALGLATAPFLGEGAWATTYPGHAPEVTIGACRPTAPCPACRQRLAETDGEFRTKHTPTEDGS